MQVLLKINKKFIMREMPTIFINLNDAFEQQGRNSELCNQIRTTMS